MGFFDKLFGRKNRTEERPAPAETAAAVETPPREKPIPPVEAPPAQALPAETLPEEILPPAPPPPEAAEETAGEPEDKPETEMPAQDLPSPREEAPEAPPRAAATAALSPEAQKKLDGSFARLRELYADGGVSRLEAGDKKLAERGAALRKLIGMEGNLDGFFALGGFTYRRSGGGRPPLPLTEEDCRALHRRIRELFHGGVPVVMAVRDADHRAFLDLRAVARREGVNVGDYLRQNGLMAGQAQPPCESTGEK